MTRDFETRRRAIARALRGTSDHSGPETRAQRHSEPRRSGDGHLEFAALTGRVNDLTARVEQLTRDMAVMRAGARDRDGPELVAPGEDVEPVERATVPPITPARTRDHAFDVLLGRAEPSTLG